jgi:polysaccharide pyruvyl transferase WcaK-like protein
LPIGERLGCDTTSAQIPLASGLLLLAHAACFISGRYHPSIMASLGGTPCIWMTSNSHKTLSVQYVLGEEEPREYPFFTQMAEPESLIAAISDRVAKSEALRPIRLSRIEAIAQTSRLSISQKSTPC